MQLRLFGLPPVPPESSLEYRLNNITIVEVGVDLLGDRVKKLPISANYKGLCPGFHEERNPSFYLKPKGNFSRCYGCGTTDSAFSLPFMIAIVTKRNIYDYFRVKWGIDLLNEEHLAKFNEHMKYESLRLRKFGLDVPDSTRCFIPDNCR